MGSQIAGEEPIKEDTKCGTNLREPYRPVGDVRDEGSKFILVSSGC